ncbi:hypothetical protein BW723_04080 [Polaribacter reichenbachii]|uniref:Secretion system C-terminal sorting domain-containing protein n=1 Tax=Polaribacter reichenbachii TaxID=996801 RepID=A0A1B8TUU4_9FLAO|nr:T9SS type A sorting domain-containing protein [Polaribacter reichenbachii]APZ45523.1 hypothetical protein BW723_04080 [Polaribacter reichenbachii]AUC19385.1 hypothetical protein BTO17_12085 [Polaribacter reichenbachii]OBY63461.1 hypothetical protein LPB301_11630 [Polaribacter reichenbachii]
MKKITLLIALFSCVLITNAQTGPTKTWVTEPPTTITQTEAFDMASTYDAGDDGAGTDYTVSSNYQYSLQILQASDGKWVWKSGVSDAAAKTTHSGSSAVSMTIATTLDTSADLPDGDQYYIRIGYQNSNGSWASYTEGNDIPVTVVAPAAIPNPPTVTWISHPESGSTMEQGKAYTFSASYDAGDNNASPLEEYLVGGTNSLQLQFSLGIAENNVWIAGQNDDTTGGTHSGTASVDFTVGTVKGDGVTPILTSAELPDGQSYVLRVSFQNSNDSWSSYSTGAHIPIVIVAPVLSTKDVSKPKLKAFYSAAKSAVVVSDQFEGDFAIFNVLGQAVLKGELTQEINVSSLQSGLYILSTERGSIKFVK